MISSVNNNSNPQEIEEKPQVRQIFRCDKVLRRVKSGYDQGSDYGNNRLENQQADERDSLRLPIAQQINTKTPNQRKQTILSSKKFPKSSKSSLIIPSFQSTAICNKSKRIEEESNKKTPSKDGYDINEDMIELKTDDSTIEAICSSGNDHSVNSSSENSSDIDIANLDIDMKDDSVNMKMVEQIVDEPADLQSSETTMEGFNYFQGLILQSIQENIEAVRRLPPYSIINNNIKKQRLLPEKSTNDHKYTLILDMDETLVHCSLQPFPGFQEIIQVMHSQEIIQIYISYRPFLTQFLDSVSRDFEVVIFTASDQQYADLILNKVDPNNQYFKHRLYRNQCVQIREQTFIKDLNLLGRDLSKTIIVDNSLLAFGYHLENGIPIPSFYGQPWDSELKILSELLNDLTLNQSPSADVRNNIVQMFQIAEKIYPPGMFSYDNTTQECNLISSSEAVDAIPLSQ